MNRTQRAVKKACHKAFDDAKKQKHKAVTERRAHLLWDYGNKTAENLKEAVKNEKSLKAWHRKIVQDYAVKSSVKEEKTA